MASYCSVCRDKDNDHKPSLIDSNSDHDDRRAKRESSRLESSSDTDNNSDNDDRRAMRDASHSDLSSDTDSNTDHDNRQATRDETIEDDKRRANTSKFELPQNVDRENDNDGNFDFEDESIHSWSTEIDTDDDNSDDDEKIPSIRPYAAPRRTGHKGHQGRRHISKKKVKLPNGDSEYISTPSVSRWRCGTRTKLITLHPRGRYGRKEYKMVEEQMDKTKMDLDDCGNRGGCYKSFKIVKVQKLINGCLWNRYEDAKRHVAREDGDSNEQLLFHGSTKIWQIVNNGLDERYSKKSGVYGAGVYFAHNSSGSNEFAFGYVGRRGCKRHNDKSCHKCKRRILLCRVALGNFYELDGGGKFFAHAPVGYHSVGGKATPDMYKEYVVYRGEQAYPEYLITYKTQP